MELTGIDIFICHGPCLETVIAAFEACGIPPGAIVRPGESIGDWPAVRARSTWVCLHAMGEGDFAYKADIDSREPFDGLAFARNLASVLGSGVVVPDENAPDPFSAFLLQPDAPAMAGFIMEVGPDGQVFRLSDRLTEPRQPADQIPESPG